MPVDFLPESVGPFPESYPLTADHAVRLVPTPGHRREHVTALVEDLHEVVFLAGDASYSQDLLVRRALDGVAADEAGYRQTQRRILELARQVPTVYLPSHDPDAAERLTKRRTLIEDGSARA